MSFRVRMEKEKEDREARRRFIEKFNEIRERNNAKLNKEFNETEE